MFIFPPYIYLGAPAYLVRALSHCTTLAVLSKVHLCAGLFLVSVLFHSSSCRFWYKHHAVFIIAPLLQVLKSGSVLPI